MTALPAPSPLPEEAEGRLEGGLTTTPLRHGPTPEQPRFPTRAAHDQALIARIRQAVTSGDLNLGDIAILCDTNAQADTAEKLLAVTSIPSVNLLDYQGLPTDKVKIGTIKRAKSLELKLVMLPWSTDVHSHSGDERLAHDIREHYVVATRARDALWVGRCES